MSRRTHILLIILLAVSVRLLAAWWWRAWETPGAGEHGSIATNLLLGNGFSRGEFSYLSPTAASTPPYPLLLAGLIKLLGLPWAWMGALLLNALAGAAVAVLGVRIVDRFGKETKRQRDEETKCRHQVPRTSSLRLFISSSLSSPSPLATGYLLALWPTQIAAATFCQPGTLAAVALLAVLALPRSAWLWSAVAAFLEPVLLPAVVLATIARDRRDPARIALTLAALLAVFVPWTLRNSISVGVVEPLTTTVWADAWAGNHDGASGSLGGVLQRETGPTRFDDLPAADRAKLNGQPEGVRTTLLRDLTFTWIAEHPLDYARLCVVRLGKTFWLDWDDARALHPVVLVSRTLWLVLVLAGVGFAFKRGVSVGPMLMIMGGAALFPILTLAQMRETLIWEPVGLVLLVAGLRGSRK